MVNGGPGLAGFSLDRHQAWPQVRGEARTNTWGLPTGMGKGRFHQETLGFHMIYIGFSLISDN
jgi:hypothetical protein